jgi:hypothetical protein
LISKKFEKEIFFESSVLPVALSGSGLSKNTGSGFVLNQSGSTTLVLKYVLTRKPDFTKASFFKLQLKHFLAFYSIIVTFKNYFAGKLMHY